MHRVAMATCSMYLTHDLARGPTRDIACDLIAQAHLHRVSVAWVCVCLRELDSKGYVFNLFSSVICFRPDNPPINLQHFPHLI